MKLRVFLWDFEPEFQGTSLPLESLEISNSGLPVSGTLSQKKKYKYGGIPFNLVIICGVHVVW